MNKLLLSLLIMSCSFCFSQDSYTSKSGLIFKVGDTIQIGQPLSKYHWISIYKEGEAEPIINRNFFNKVTTIDKIVLDSEFPRLYFTLYKKQFYIDVETALINKELLPSLKREFARKEKGPDKYDQILKLKKLLDVGAITEEEYNIEKAKLLKS